MPGLSETLLPYIQVQKRASGRIRYYYQRHRGSKMAGPRVRLPDDPSSIEFMEAYEAASRSKTARAEPYPKRQRGYDAVALLAGARQRARQAGVPFDLTEEFILKMMDRQKMRCAVTGLKMTARTSGDPFAWSIDRRHGPTGYVQNNVRLVCRITNMAMNQWGEETLLQFIRMAYISTVTGNKL
jgi:hypothetical protein